MEIANTNRKALCAEKVHDDDKIALGHAVFNGTSLKSRRVVDEGGGVKGRID